MGSFSLFFFSSPFFFFFFLLLFLPPNNRAEKKTYLHLQIIPADLVARQDPDGDFIEAIGRQHSAETAARIIKEHMSDWKNGEKIRP